MKKFVNDFENVSAFFDDELSSTEKATMHEKIRNSSALRDALSSYAQIHKNVSSLPPLPDDPSFESRLYDTIENEKKGFFHFFSFRKPVIAFATVTILLMVFFKFNPNVLDNMFEEQKSNLEEFYAQNLRPLFLEDKVSNDDLMNFAFHKEIPINKSSNQVLRLEDTPEGGAVMEVGAPLGQRSDRFSYDSYVNSLDLDSSERQQIDSIMESYSELVTKSILVDNDNNTLAFAPKLVNVQAALQAELLAFASEYGRDMKAGFLPQFRDVSHEVQRLVSTTKSIGPEEYYVFSSDAPDTIFSVALTVNLDSIRSDIKNNKNNAYYYDHNVFVSRPVGRHRAKTVSVPSFEGSEKYDSILSRQLEVFIDSQYCKINIPNIPHIPFAKKEWHEFRQSLDSASIQLQNFSFNITIDTIGLNKSLSVNMNIPGMNQEQLQNFLKFGMMGSDSTIGSFYYNFNDSALGVVNIDSLIEITVQKYGGESSPFLKNLPQMILPNMTPDSLAYLFNQEFFPMDGTDLQEEMENFREEMKQLKEEMKKLRKELRNNK